MAFDTYITIKDIEGEVVAAGVEKSIEVYSFSWGVSAQVTPGSTGGAALSAGKAQMSSFNIMKKVDKASAKLFQSVADGKQIPEATVVMRKAINGKQEIFLKYVFSGLMVESVQWSGSSGGDDTPTESVSLAFAKCSIEYTMYDGKGTASKAGMAAWDLHKLTNK
jgi:type VI secretion system secreted protein Hcp